MKKILISLVLSSLLLLNGCYYSRYERVSDDYYAEDSTYYYSDPIGENPPVDPPIVVVPLPCPVPVHPVQPSRPPADKYRPGTSTGDRVVVTKPEAHRDSNRNIDMTTVKVNRQNDNSGLTEGQSNRSNQNGDNSRNATVKRK